MTPGYRNIDEVQVSFSKKRVGLWILAQEGKNPDQSWQFRMWQDEKDPDYFYLIGRVTG